MKRADIRFLVEVFKTDTAPAFAKMPDDDTTVAFCEMQCILAAITIRGILEKSTPESRADFVRRWNDALENHYKDKAAAEAVKDEKATASPRRRKTVDKTKTTSGTTGRKAKRRAKG